MREGDEKEVRVALDRWNEREGIRFSAGIDEPGKCGVAYGARVGSAMHPLVAAAA